MASSGPLVDTLLIVIPSLKSLLNLFTFLQQNSQTLSARIVYYPLNPILQHHQQMLEQEDQERNKESIMFNFKGNSR